MKLFAHRLSLVLVAFGVSLLAALLAGPAEAQERDRSRNRERSTTTERNVSPGSSESPGAGVQRQTHERDGDRSADRSDARSMGDLDSFELPGNLPQPNPAQQANLQQLKQDLATLGQGAQAADDEIRQLADHLQGMAAQPPDPALVQQLANDLAAAVADSSLSPKEAKELTEAVYAVLNSAGLSAAEVQTLKSDVEAILQASGVGRAEIQAVLNDLQAIYDAAQKPAGGSPTRKTQRRGRG